MAPRSLEKSVALVVCGKFHYFNYAKLLARAGVLKQFCYSHRLNADPKLGTAASGENLWWKEYAYHAHLRLFGVAGLSRLERVYHGLWKFQLKRVLEPVPIVHFLLHGNCLGAIRRSRIQGSVIIADAVNSHPSDYFSLIDGEYQDLGLPLPKRGVTAESAIYEEIALADRILVPSVFVEKSYLKHGIAAEKIRRINYGANLSDFCPLAKTGQVGHRAPFRVVVSGQVTPRKGIQYLLRAWKTLRLPDAELHFFGAMQRDVMPALRQIGASNVHFHGAVSRNKLIAEMQQSDLLVLPTVEDGFGIVILEALACGLPVIATVNSGGPDLLADGRAGFVVPIRSVEHLAEKIEWCYRYRDEAEEMGRAGRILVEDKYTWEGYAEKLIAYYAECLNCQTD